jgi:hypothetical protein
MVNSVRKQSAFLLFPMQAQSISGLHRIGPNHAVMNRSCVWQFQKGSDLISRKFLRLKVAFLALGHLPTDGRKFLNQIYLVPRSG